MGYFKSERQNGPRKYVTNANMKASKKRNSVFWIMVMLLIMVAITTVILAIRFRVGKENALSTQVSYYADEPSKSMVDAAPDTIPDYSETDVIELNDNIPFFTDFDYDHINGEAYSDLDSEGRCGTAVAMLDRGMMPQGERGEIGGIKPTGWVQNKYPGIVDASPPYLYNRSHLIAYAMTGQNANEKNLITGTRYMNANLMLPYEKEVLKYLDNSENHVLYRVSPYFKGDELLARGVEMEAYSIEDKGEGVSFHVFIYNVQPGVEIDYKTGENSQMK